MHKKGPRDIKPSNNLLRYLPKKDKSEDKSAPQTTPHNPTKRKVCLPLHDSLSVKERPKTPLPPPLPKKTPLWLLLRPVPLE
jgi:hypothetical protein